jgi:hypothetical protein
MLLGRKLEGVCVLGDVRHLSLHVEVAGGKGLLRVYDAHADILLVDCSNLLLLVL